MYARGNGKEEDWRAEMAAIAAQVVQRPDLKESGELRIVFPNAEHRKRVEAAAIATAVEELEQRGYRTRNRQKANCGYDLLAIRSRSPRQLHVEVKGTSTGVPHFIMTENERNCMQLPKWRLALVTYALDNPEIEIMDATETKERFTFAPLAWNVTLKKV